MGPRRKPLIVGLGGTLRPGSSTERVLRACLDAAERRGAEIRCLAGPDLDLPHYLPGRPLAEPARRLVDLLRASDGLVIVSPGYHGSVSGMVKNALDYIEEMRGDDPPYLERRAVGCIAAAAGWQAAVNAMAALRDVVHALRGWPTPMGIAINSEEPLFAGEGGTCEATVAARLAVVADQVVGFAEMQRAWRERPSRPEDAPGEVHRES